MAAFLHVRLTSISLLIICSRVGHSKQQDTGPANATAHLGMTSDALIFIYNNPRFRRGCELHSESIEVIMSSVGNCALLNRKGGLSRR